MSGYTATQGPESGTPAIPVEQVQRLVASHLSVRARVAYAGLFLVAVTVAVGVASLWMTEPALPTRTQAGFGAMVILAMAWAIVAARVLTTRRVLLGRHRVAVARLAVGFSALLVAGAAIAGARGSAGAAGWILAVLGVVMLAISVGGLAAARRHVARLTARREALAHELRSHDPAGPAGAAR